MTYIGKYGTYLAALFLACWMVAAMTGNTKVNVEAKYMPPQIQQQSGTKDTPIANYNSGERPRGQLDYCLRHGWDCKTNKVVSIIPYDKRVAGMIDNVNRQVNNQMHPAVGDLDGRSTDKIIFGVDEKWAYTKEDGDCEDVALVKRHKLMEMGFPMSSLLLTVVSADPRNGRYDHMVLTVRTTRGDFILDVNDERVLPWYQTPYKFVLRQNAKNRTSWDVLDDSRQIRVSSR